MIPLVKDVLTVALASQAVGVGTFQTNEYGIPAGASKLTAFFTRSAWPINNGNDVVRVKGWVSVDNGATWLTLMELSSKGGAYINPRTGSGAKSEQSVSVPAESLVKFDIDVFAALTTAVELLAQ